jgi:hypothetical protein
MLRMPSGSRVGALTADHFQRGDLWRTDWLQQRHATKKNSTLSVYVHFDPKLHSIERKIAT